MSSPPRMLFRQEALDERLRRREDAPSTPPTRFFRLRVALWLVLAVTMTGATGAFLLPVASTAVALVVTPAEPVPGGYVAILLDPGEAANVTPGARVTIAPMDAPGTRSATVVTLEATPLSPESVSERLGLAPAMTAMLPPQLTLAWGEITSEGDLVAGTIDSATVELRDIRAGSVVPVIGHWFGGE